MAEHTVDGFMNKALGMPDEIARLQTLNRELVDMLERLDKRVAWESLGLGNTVAEEVEALIARAKDNT